MARRGVSVWFAPLRWGAFELKNSTLQSISKTFRKSGKALDKVNLKVEAGEMVALIGPSGSGKSTLLRHLSGLVPSDATPSTITLLGQVVQRHGHIASDIRHIRAEVGFIFQQFNLVGRLPLLTNVLVGMLPRVPLWRSLIRYFTYPEKREAMQALARVDMAEFATQRASTLSGGQQQRGAIARTMVQQAEILLADEPIASLDPESSRKVMESLAKLNQEDGVTILVSLHQIDFATRYCPRSMEAVKRAHGEICAQTVDAEGNPGYWSLIVAHRDSKFNSIDHIIAAGKSLSFGNGDPNSASGYLIPTYYIWSKRGIDPNTHFGKVRSANHETNLMAVATRQVDFATNNTESMRRLELSNPEMFKQIKILWQSPLIPSDPLVWRNDLSREMKAKIKGFLLSYGRFGPNTEEERKVLAAASSGWAPFNDSGNLQLLPIREISHLMSACLL